MIESVLIILLTKIISCEVDLIDEFEHLMQKSIR